MNSYERIPSKSLLINILQLLHLIKTLFCTESNEEYADVTQNVSLLQLSSDEILENLDASTSTNSKNLTEEDKTMMVQDFIKAIQERISSPEDILYGENVDRILVESFIQNIPNIETFEASIRELEELHNISNFLAYAIKSFCLVHNIPFLMEVEKSSVEFFLGVEKNEAVKNNKAKASLVFPEGLESIMLRIEDDLIKRLKSEHEKQISKRKSKEEPRLVDILGFFTAIFKCKNVCVIEMVADLSNSSWDSNFFDTIFLETNLRLMELSINERFDFGKIRENLATKLHSLLIILPRRGASREFKPNLSNFTKLVRLSISAPNKVTRKLLIPSNLSTNIKVLVVSGFSLTSRFLEHLNERVSLVELHILDSQLDSSVKNSAVSQEFLIKNTTELACSDGGTKDFLELFVSTSFLKVPFALRTLKIDVDAEENEILKKFLKDERNRSSIRFLSLSGNKFDEDTNNLCFDLKNLESLQVLWEKTDKNFKIPERSGCCKVLKTLEITIKGDFVPITLDISNIFECERLSLLVLKVSGGATITAENPKFTPKLSKLQCLEVNVVSLQQSIEPLLFLLSSEDFKMTLKVLRLTVVSQIKSLKLLARIVEMQNLLCLTLAVPYLDIRSTGLNINPTADHKNLIELKITAPSIDELLLLIINKMSSMCALILETDVEDLCNRIEKLTNNGHAILTLPLSLQILEISPLKQLSEEILQRIKSCFSSVNTITVLTNGETVQIK